MKQPMGPPAYRAAGRDGADLLSAEKIVNEPRRTAASDAARASTKPRGKFYLGSAAALLLVVLVGFAPTFYLRSAFGGREFSWRGGVPELSWRVLVHGLILTSWFLAFALQAALVAARRTGLHRALGWAGAAIGLAVIISGGIATPYRMAELAAQGRPESRIATASILVWSNTASIVAFAILLAAAIVLRRRPDTHKRLMLLASISIIQPAFASYFSVACVRGAPIGRPHALRGRSVRPGRRLDRLRPSVTQVAPSRHGGGRGRIRRLEARRRSAARAFQARAVAGSRHGRRRLVGPTRNRNKRRNRRNSLEDA